MFHVILYQPEIPPNTGNIIRLCANTGCTLHLIEPLGFSLDEKNLRRAGLDYHQLTHLKVHPDLGHCQSELASSRFFALSAKGKTLYTKPQFQAGDAFLFGPETRGLPYDLLQRFCAKTQLCLPQKTRYRSLNLANTVGIMIYEAWCQQDFL